MTHFDLLKFYGVDWAAMTLQLLSFYMLGQKERVGFLLAFGGCFAWLLFGLITGSVADILANSIGLVLSAKGYINWSQSVFFPRPIV